eukprot:8699716-Lingulodinium_polyedra.AAC.1
MRATCVCSLRRTARARPLRRGWRLRCGSLRVEQKTRCGAKRLQHLNRQRQCLRCAALRCETCEVVH